MKITAPLGCWRIGTRVRKRKGASWQGYVVGYYSTSLTDVGYCVESEREPGSVQIYPASALEWLAPEWLGSPRSPMTEETTDQQDTGSPLKEPTMTDDDKKLIAQLRDQSRAHQTYLNLADRAAAAARIEALTAEVSADLVERAAVVAWLREDAAKTRDYFRRLHLNLGQTSEWQTFIEFKVAIANAIERGDHLAAIKEAGRG